MHEQCKKPTASGRLSFIAMANFSIIRSKRVAVIFVVTILLVHSGYSQWFKNAASEEHAQKGITLVYNLSFDSAKAEFQQILRLEPEHPAGYFFLAMVEWWRIAVDVEDKTRDNRFITLLENVVDMCDKRLGKNEHDSVALFFKGGALGFRGRLYAFRDDWLKAANDGRVALQIVREAYSLSPNNYDVLLGMGIYNYYAEVIPEQYPLVKPLMIFFPKGDKEQGIRQLKKASEKATFANIEATYFLVQLFYYYEKQYPEALSLALRLYARFPNNPIFEKFVGRCYAATGQWEKMHNIFAGMLQGVEQKKFGYAAATECEAQYYLGEYDMNTGKYDFALPHYYRCDEISRTLDKDRSAGFMAMTNLKIGMIYDVQRKRDIAVKQYNKVLSMTDYQNAHEQAERYLKTPYGKF